MFTIKAYDRVSFVRIGFCALWYTIDEAGREVRFEVPHLPGVRDCEYALQKASLDKYFMISIENLAGREVDRLKDYSWPHGPKAEVEDAS